MNQPHSGNLNQIVELLRAGRVQEARPLLVEYIRCYPNSEQGWLLMSRVVADPGQKADCLRRALRINPNNHQARKALAGLTPSSPVKAPASAAVYPPPYVPPPAPAQEVEEEELPAKSVPHPVMDAEAQDASPPAGETLTELQPRDDAPRAEEELSAISLEEDEPPSAPPPARQAKPRRRKPVDRLPWILVTIFVLFLGGIILAGSLAGLRAYERIQSDATANVFASQTAMRQKVLLPATWTATATSTVTPIPSVTPTPSRTPTATYVFPGATASFQMDVIQEQVSDLRGLVPTSSAPRYMMTRDRVETVLRDYLITEEYQLRLADMQRVLNALGLIKPTYDLTTYALNGLADGIGGLYLPEKSEIYIVGAQFSGIERLTFAHEYGHALVDQHYDFNQLGLYPFCQGDGQRCHAITALIEGDATLVMYQWLVQYASPQDHRDLVNYKPPPQLLPEQFPPPALVADINFPYEYGLAFVQHLHNSGNWAEVNRAYIDLPESTEQIMHPELYVRGETPIPVDARPLAEVLGEGWRLLESNILGEWMTYLILAHSADVAAQLDESDASAAARGWGGDAYQVYHHAAEEQTLLVAHWVWDTSADSGEFNRAFLDHQRERFRGFSLEHPSGNCWEVNLQTSCVFAQGRETLWVLAPDQAKLEAVLGVYQEFR